VDLFSTKEGTAIKIPPASVDNRRKGTAIGISLARLDKASLLGTGDR
jgi:hypothetical protein